MNPQNYDNHARYVKGYHFWLSAMLTGALIISITNVVRHWYQGGRAVNLLLVLITVCLLFIAWFARVFAIKAQDRAIRAEEKFRYFMLAGKAISSNVTMRQIIALRFAHDDEFVALTDKAVAENLSSTDIKKAIQNWRADEHRA